MPRGSRRKISPRHIAPADPIEAVARSASECQRIATAALSAVALRDDASGADRDVWTIDLSVDSGCVMLQQRIEVPYGSGGPGYDSPRYNLAAYDSPDAPRRFYLSLPTLPGADEALGALTALQVYDTLDALRTLCDRAVSLGILPALEGITGEEIQDTSRNLRVAR